ncbi:ATP-binding protein [Roseomonas elaeocarpi]|uniref:Winged helix-turn-helix domain-containing protein n=1 Tax=Roseomonas elaeocarpi TaxID=907779 RepID=A0ABV6JN23_9PROT
MTDAVFLFGAFELSVAQQRLSRDGVPLQVGSRALAILQLLLERAGETVSNRDIMTRVWPDLFVEDANIRVHVSALRRSMGAGARITNHPAQGYRFEGSVRRGEAALTTVTVEARHRLPPALTPLMGREDDLARLVAALPERRLITIIGPGGIGKTSLALAVGRALAARYPDGVCFVDLASVSGGELVFGAAARALCPGATPPADVVQLGRQLATRRMLVLIDNCEHVVDDAALLAEDLLRAAPDLALLATSRESLRAEGEWLHRLGPLAVPPPDAPLSPDEAQRFSAVALFLERAASVGLRTTPDDAVAAASICRKLDGVPLAIELAAARVDSFGVEGLEKRLDDRLALLTAGRRTSAARHRTLQATLDWSYNLLLPDEQAMLRALGAFRGSFTLEEAAAVAAEAEMPLGEAADRLDSLVSKSLLSVILDDDRVTYRMLDTTRHDAVRRLRGTGEAAAVSRRHAAQVRRGIAALSSADVRRRIDDLRAALRWCFGEEGDVPLGLALTAAAAPAFFGLSLMAEYRGHAERALAALDGADHDPKDEMALLVALGPAIYNTEGPVPQARACFVRALPIAEAVGDAAVQQRALWGLFLCSYGHARYAQALEHAEEFVRRSREWGDPTHMGTRMRTLSHLYGGDARQALALAEETLARPVEAKGHGPSGFQYEQRAVAGSMRARALWLLGRPASAWRQMEASVEEAIEGGHALSTCFVLTHAACPISFWTGDDEAAGRYAALLLEHSASQALSHWNRSGRLFRRALDAKAGILSIDPKEPLTGAEWSDGYLEAFTVMDLGVLPDRLVTRALTEPPVWCTAEVLRVHALALLERGPDRAAEAEALLARSLEMARQQGLLVWELRTATAMAALRRRQHRPDEARALLNGVLREGEEDWPSPDRRRAEALLASLDLPRPAAIPMKGEHHATT